MSVAEALLQDILDQSKITNANLVNLLRQSTNLGSNSGTPPINSILTTSVARFNLLNMAITGITSVGNLLSNTFSGLVNIAGTTVSKLVDLAQAAFQGTAKFSDLFKVLDHVPIIGKVFGLFANFISYQEDLLKSYQEITKSGASFSGNLIDMRIAAARAYMDLNNFGQIVRENSGLFATAIGGIDKGIRIFTEAQNKLVDPKGPLGKNLMGLGVTAEEAGNMLALYMNMQGNISKVNKQSSMELANSTNSLVVNLDAYAKLTGESREEMEKKLKEAALDEQLKSFLSALSPDEVASANLAIESALKAGGKGLADEVKIRILSNNKIQVAGTDAANNLRVTTRNMSASSADFYFQAFKMGQKNEQFVSQMEKGRMLIARGTTQFMNQLGGPGMAGAINAVGGSFQFANEQSRTYNRLQGETISAEQRLQVIREEQQKQFKGTAAALASAQMNLKIFGNQLGIRFFEILQPVEGPIIRVGNLLMNSFGGIVNYLAKDNGPLSKLAYFIEEHLAPAIDWAANWIKDTFYSLSESTTVDDFFKRLGDRFTILWNKMSDEFGPPLTKFWNETAKPIVANAAKDMIEWFVTALRKNSKIARWLFDETETEKNERTQMENDPLYQAILQRAKNEATEQSKQSWGEFATSGEPDLEAIKQQWIAEKERLKADAQAQAAQQANEEAIRLMFKRMSIESSGVADRDTGSLGKTGHIFENFGGGTKARLHGTEGVITPSQMGEIIGNALKQNENSKLFETMNQLNQINLKTQGINNDLLTQMNQLNNLTKELVGIMHETSNTTRKNLNVLESLNGNLLA